jgi:hypothetical protein
MVGKIQRIDRFFIPALVSMVLFVIIAAYLAGWTNLNQVVIDILVALATGALIATISIRYTFIQQKKLDYYEYMDAVLLEMKENLEKLDQLPTKINELETGWKLFKESWIQGKVVALWPRGTRYFYQYLSDNNFISLLNSGYVRKLLPEYLEPLGFYYLNCRKLNDETQTIEDEIDDIRKYIRKNEQGINFENPEAAFQILHNYTIRRLVDSRTNKKNLFLINGEGQLLGSNDPNSTKPSISLPLRIDREYELKEYSENISLENFLNNAIIELRRLSFDYGGKIRQDQFENIETPQSRYETISRISSSDMKSWLLGIIFY